MKRIFRILGLSMVVVSILAIALAGTALAAGPNTDNGTQTQNQGEECLCGECPCAECPSGECVSGDCGVPEIMHSPAIIFEV